MPHLDLFPFRYRDPRTGKWVRARYRAELREIEARYAEWEVTGPSEIREVDPDARAFSPHRQTIGNLGPVLEVAEWQWRYAPLVPIVGIAT